MQVNETNENKEFTPLIVAFCCNWCSYAGVIRATAITQLVTTTQEEE